MIPSRGSAFDVSSGPEYLLTIEEYKGDTN